MGDFCENEALLPRTLPSHHKPCRGDGDSTTDEDDSCGRVHDWWDESSSRSSCSSYSCSESEYEDHKSDIEWETYINSHGELFYVESNVTLVPNLKTPGETSPKNVTSKRKRSGGRLSGLMTYKRRANKKFIGWFWEGWPSVSSCRSDTLIPRYAGSRGSLPSNNVWSNRSSMQGSGGGGGNKVTFRDSQEGETREVGISVDPGMRNLGRRATLCETLLGIVPGVFSSSATVAGDQGADAQSALDDRIMVAGFVPDGEAIKNRSIKIGDWLRKIDGKEVTFKTIDRVLSSIISSCMVNLTLQRIAGCDVTADLPPEIKSKPLEQSKLVRTLVGSTGEGTRSAISNHPVGLLYVGFPKNQWSQDGIPVSENDGTNGIIYCYPPNPQENVLASLCGSFLTLKQLVPEITPSAPVSATVLLKEQKTHVVYSSEDSEMLLVATPDNCCSIPEAVLLTEELIRALRFNFQTLSKAFKDTSHRSGLDHLLDIYFTRILIGGFWNTGKISNVCNEIASKASLPSPHLFEQILPAGHMVPLPRDVQNQIDDALTQLEAADFQCLVEDHQQCQRLLTIVGSCLYHKGYLLASHIPSEDLPYVHSFLNQFGILHLCQTEPVRSLVFWREVYLASCNQGISSSTAGESENYPLPLGRWFLLLVGKGQVMLAVIVEMGGCSYRQEGCIPPDPDYVNHAKSTLNHIHDIGIPAVCDSWLSSGGLPQVDSMESILRNLSMRKGFRGRSKSKGDKSFVSFRRSSEPTPPSKTFHSGSSGMVPQSPNKKIEVTSILKRRESPALLATSQDLGETTASEDSVSITGANGTREGSITYGFGSDDSSSIGGLAVGGSVVGRRAQRESLGGSTSSSRQNTSPSTSTGIPVSAFSSSSLRVSISSRSSVSDCDENDESSDGSDWELYRSHGSKSQPYDLIDLKNNLLNEVTDLNPTKLTTGEKNVLLFYLSVNESDGVFLCPPDFPTNDSSSMQYLVQNFRRSCLHIHNLLQHSIAFKDVKGPDISVSWINKSLVAVKEHGVLFDFLADGTVDGFKKSSMPLSYWVVGRLFFSPQPKEVYVCYYDAAPQNMVEIAFRLGLSVTG